MKLIIAEKPFVAREIAVALNITEKKDGFITNSEYAVTWAFGHLIELCPPEEYGWSSWVAESLPMLPKEFKVRPTHKYIATEKKWVLDFGVSKQLSVIDDLFNKASEIIVATDAGREGELIFRYIYQYLKCNKPFKRLWISVLTKKSILKGFEELKDGTNYDSLFNAARCRSEADWLVGMNASRSLSIAAGKGTYSLGRVQTPTLAIICSRYVENKNFVAEPFYNISITAIKNNQAFTAFSEPFKDKEIADTIYSQIRNAKNAKILTVETKEKAIAAPLLYDLTSLQRDANKQLNYSADNTLKIAQTLYEKGLISYPRTGSCYISEDIFDTIPELLKNAAKHTEFGKDAIKLSTSELNKRSVNEEKITDHHALIITENFPTSLSNEEQSIYDLILCRMLEAFSPNCITDVTTISLDCAAELFKATGTIIKTSGWKAIKKTTVIVDEKNNTEENNEQLFPSLIPHETIEKTGDNLLSKMTKPKPIHTEASLLLAMETCGKYIDDESLKESLKDCGIGTPATRAANIETLLFRGYIERQKKNLIPTPKGLQVYHLLKDKPIASAELTGQWEKRLSLIEKKQEDAIMFMKDIVAYTVEVTKELLTMNAAFIDADVRETNKDILHCPKCKKGELRKGVKNYYCSDYKNTNCNFVVWLIVASKVLTERQILDIATKGKSGIIKGFKNKAGNEFEAYLTIKDDFTVGFEFAK